MNHTPRLSQNCLNSYSSYSEKPTTLVFPKATQVWLTIDNAHQPSPKDRLSPTLCSWQT